MWWTVLVSANYLNEVKQFAIGEISPHSNHCPITFYLSSKACSIFTSFKLCKHILDIPVAEELHPISTRSPVSEMKETLLSMRVMNENLAEVYANKNVIRELELLEIDLLY